MSQYKVSLSREMHKVSELFLACIVKIWCLDFLKEITVLFFSPFSLNQELLTCRVLKSKIATEPCEVFQNRYVNVPGSFPIQRSDKVISILHSL